MHDKGVTTKYVQTRYDNLLKQFGNEIEVLLNTPIESIEKVDPLLSKVINSYRNNGLNVNPGRGGQYGTVEYN